jgi:hypothetical protein
MLACQSIKYLEREPTFSFTIFSNAAKLILSSSGSGLSKLIASMNATNTFLGIVKPSAVVDVAVGASLIAICRRALCPRGA